MIRHVVLRSLAPNATAEQISAMEERTRAFVDIAGVHSVVTGANLDLVPRSEGFDHVTVLDLEDEEALRFFVAHPQHAASAAVSGPLSTRILVVDVALG